MAIKYNGFNLTPKQAAQLILEGGMLAASRGEDSTLLLDQYLEGATVREKGLVTEQIGKVMSRVTRGWITAASLQL